MARDPETIQREIEKARDALAESLDALSERASPKRFVDQGRTSLLERLADPKIKYGLMAVGALVAFALVSVLAVRAGRGTSAIILAGVAGSQLFNALTSFIVTKAANAEQARGIMFWLLGNLSGVRWPEVWLALPVALAGLLVCLWHARALDAFTFGTESAASLGIPVRRVYVVLIAVSALMTAVMVSIVGSIGFVGLVIPHLFRLMIGPAHRLLIPFSAAGGALLVMLADLAARTLDPPSEVPIGVIMGSFGGPFFLWMIYRSRRFGISAS